MPVAYSKSESPFLNEVRIAIRLKRFSLSTERSYLYYIHDFIVFSGKKHPRDMGQDEVRAYLNHLALSKQVAASTQNVALAALLFLYGVVLDRDLGHVADVVRAKRPKRLPVVLTRSEVMRLFAELERRSSPYLLELKLLYGSGLRLMEALRLRIKDVDFEGESLTVRSGKGNKDRVTVLPNSLQEPLTEQLEWAQALHKKDKADGFGEVYLPGALAKKYPGAATSWSWQYIFPARNRSHDPRSDRIGRHHVSKTAVQRSMRKALAAADIV